MENSKIELMLQLFAEGGESAGVGDTGVNTGDPGSAAAGQGAKGVTAAAAGQHSSGVASGNGGDPADAGQGDQVEDLEAEFEELINGKFKKQFDTKQNTLVRERLKGTQSELKTAQEELKRFEAAAPVFQILAQKYGLEETDLEGIAEKAAQDKSFFEHEAMEKGVDLGELMHLKSMERENSTMRQQLERQREAERVAREQAQKQAQMKKWNQEQTAMQQKYPDFQLAEACKNDTFNFLMAHGYTMESAYKAAFSDQLAAEAARRASQETQKRVTDDLIAGQGRPAENGSGGGGAVSSKLDPKNMTPKQIEDLWARARRGEKIYL